MKLIFNWILYAIAIAVTAYLLPGVVVSGFGTALIVAVVLGLINMILRPILVILTLPINILSLGLFTFIINAVLVLLASHLVTGFFVASFWTAILFAIVLAIVHAFLNIFKAAE